VTIHGGGGALAGDLLALGLLVPRDLRRLRRDALAPVLQVGLFQLRELDTRQLVLVDQTLEAAVFRVGLRVAVLRAQRLDVPLADVAHRERARNDASLDLPEPLVGELDSLVERPEPTALDDGAQALLESLAGLRIAPLRAPRAVALVNRAVADVSAGTQLMLVGLMPRFQLLARRLGVDLRRHAVPSVGTYCTTYCKTRQDASGQVCTFSEEKREGGLSADIRKRPFLDLHTAGVTGSNPVPPTRTIRKGGRSGGSIR